MGRRGRTAWGAAFGVSGLLWLVAQTWEDPGPPSEREEQGTFACISVTGGPPCAPGPVVDDDEAPYGPADSECMRSAEACLEVWPRERHAEPDPSG